jgi:hypothetical protein
VVAKCFNETMAKKLPKAFFTCIKGGPKGPKMLMMVEDDGEQQVEVVMHDGETVVEAEVPASEAQCVLKSQQPSCDADTSCAWCRSASLPPRRPLPCYR